MGASVQPLPSKPIEMVLMEQANDAVKQGADPHAATEMLGTMIKHLRANPQVAAHANNAMAQGADPHAVSSKVWELAQSPGELEQPGVLSRAGSVSGAAASDMTSVAPDQASRRAAAAAAPPILSSGLAREVEQGATLGFGDEINALVRSSPGARMLVGGKSYQAALAAERADAAEYENANPLTSISAQLAGGVGAASMLPGVAAARGLSTGARVIRSAKTGAAIGAVSGAGTSEGNILDRAQGAALGGVTGAAAGGMVGSLPEGNSLGKRLVRRVGSGTVIGAGVGAAGSPDDRLGGAGVGALVGAGAGAAATAAGTVGGAAANLAGLRRPASPVGPVLEAVSAPAGTPRRVGPASVRQRADQLLLDAANSGGRKVADMRAVVDATSPDKPVTFADVAGKGVRQLVAGAQTFGKSKAATRIPELIDARAEGSGARLSSDMTAASGLPPANPYELANQMSDARRTQANQHYADAYAHGNVDDASIDEMLKLPYFKDAYGFAKNLAKLEGRQLPQRLVQVVEKGELPKNPGGFSDEQWAASLKGSGVKAPDKITETMQEVPDVEALDMVKRGIDAQIQKNLNRNSIDKAAAVKLQARLEQFLSKIDAAVPEYGKARAAYHESSKMLEALEAGRSAVKKDPRAVELELKALQSPHEQGLYRFGLQDALSEVIAGTRDGSSVSGKLAGSDIARHQLSLIAKDAPSAADLLKRAGEERLMDRSNRDMGGGSNTMNKSGAAAAIEEAGADLPGHVPTTPKAMVKFLWGRVANYTRGLNPQIGDALADRAMAGFTDRAELNRALDALQALESKGQLTAAKTRELLKLPAAAQAGKVGASK